MKSLRIGKVRSINKTSFSFFGSCLSKKQLYFFGFMIVKADSFIFFSLLYFSEKIRSYKLGKLQTTFS